MPAYIQVLKPSETALLTFYGTATAVVAGGGRADPKVLLLVFIALLIGSAGVNGITNYLDRDFDARMERTRNRPLPAGRISPPEKALPWIISLIVAGLALSWFLDPLCPVFGLVGLVAAITARKTAITHWMGIISSVIPGLIAWQAVRHGLDLSIAFICLIIAFWVPMHVWSLMLAYRDDYWQAGYTYFPLTVSERTAESVLLLFAVLLSSATLALYSIGKFTFIYLAGAIVLSAVVIVANINLLIRGTGKNAWRVYKLSAYPFLGMIFLLMMVDRLIT